MEYGVGIRLDGDVLGSARFQVLSNGSLNRSRLKSSWDGRIREMSACHPLRTLLSTVMFPR